MVKYTDSSNQSLSLTTTETVVAISEETLHTINASAEYSIRLPPKIGDGYMGSVEAFHQLHCLNMLRQATYADYYRGKTEAWKDSPQRLRNHLGRVLNLPFTKDPS